MPWKTSNRKAIPMAVGSRRSRQPGTLSGSASLRRGTSNAGSQSTLDVPAAAPRRPSSRRTAPTRNVKSSAAPPPAEPRSQHPGPTATWTFLSNHAHVLVCLARDPNSRLRDVAELVGITERGVFRIVAELESAGVIRRHREGRRNRYDIDTEVALRHPVEAERTVGSLLAGLLSPTELKALLRATHR